jgi:hypothetical protein
MIELKYIHLKIILAKGNSFFNVGLVIGQLKPVAIRIVQVPDIFIPTDLPAEVINRTDVLQILKIDWKLISELPVQGCTVNYFIHSVNDTNGILVHTGSHDFITTVYRREIKDAILFGIEREGHFVPFVIIGKQSLRFADQKRVNGIHGLASFLPGWKGQVFTFR